MALDILTWIGFGGMGAVSILAVYLIIAWVWPARNSAARHFIKGRRENKEVVALDDGSRWMWKVAEKRGQGVLIDDEGLPIFVTPKSLKWGGGVYFGVGEYFRSTLANISVVEFLCAAKAEGYDKAKLARLIEEVNRAMKKIEEPNVGNRKEKTQRREDDDAEVTG